MNLPGKQTNNNNKSKKTWVGSRRLHGPPGLFSAAALLALSVFTPLELQCCCICHNFCSLFVNVKCLNVELPFKRNWQVAVEVLRLKCFLDEAFLRQMCWISIVKAVTYKVNYDPILFKRSSQSGHNQQNVIQPSLILLLTPMLVILRHVKISAGGKKNKNISGTKVSFPIIVSRRKVPEWRFVPVSGFKIGRGVHRFTRVWRVRTEIITIFYKYDLTLWGTHTHMHTVIQEQTPAKTRESICMQGSHLTTCSNSS